MENLKLRSEAPEDFRKIIEIHNLAFNTPGEGKLVNGLRESVAFVPDLSIVAEQEGAIVGHILFSKITLTQEGVDFNCLSLAPVAVVPEYQGKGVGKKMIQEGIRRAQSLGFSSILVLGSPKYYGKFGFKHELTNGIICKYKCAEFQGLELKSDCLKNLKSAVATYPEAFSVVD